MEAQQSRLLKIPVVAKRLGINPRTVIRYFEAGLLVGKVIPNKTRRTILIYKSSLETFLEASE